MPRSARRPAVHRPTDPSGSARIGAPSVRAARSATLRETGKVLGDPGTDPLAAHGGTPKRRPDSRLQFNRSRHTQRPALDPIVSIPGVRARKFRPVVYARRTASLTFS